MTPTAPGRDAGGVKDRIMRKPSLLALLLLLPALGLVAPTRAQEPAADVVFLRHRMLWIPFNTGAGVQRLKQLQLFVSTDQGKTWQPSAIAAPDQEKFRFVSETDGQFWFTVQTLDVDGRLYPERLDGVAPSRKIIIDTTPPQVSLRPLLSNGSEVGVAWEVRDEHLDLNAPDALRLEYRVQGQAQWQPLPVQPHQGQLFWNPRNTGILEVRLRARDRAGNWGEATTQTSLNGQVGVPAPGQNQNVNLPPGLDPDRKFVNSKRISLQYEIKDKGPSGVSSIELWYTLDGRSWNRYLAKKGEEVEQGPLVFDVEQEGIYGFTLVARSGVDLGERPPQVGERPQIWVEVDLSKPLVQIQSVIVGQGQDKGKLAITWSASDRNLAASPIALAYSQTPNGPWTPIGDKMVNSGRYVWTMPEQRPYQFHIRVEAWDRAGNVGEAITQNLIKVDLSQPKAKIVDVQPGR